MQIVGIDDPRNEATHVHTVDIWFSERRGIWVVERLNAVGDLLGPAFSSKSEMDARSCLAEWLRAHTETYLAAPGEAAIVPKRASTARRRAA